MTGFARAHHPSRWSLVLGLGLLALAVTPVAADAGGQSGVAGARAATASFHDLAAANAAGYSVEVADLDGITCIASSSGAMGVHYLNPSLVPELFDPAAAAEVDAATPELLVFGPGPNGQLRLVALEYLTIKASWDSQHAAPPSLFGRTFDTTPAGNRYGLPDFYSLHAWVWAPNSDGMFAPFNPRVSCA